MFQVLEDNIAETEIWLTESYIHKDAQKMERKDWDNKPTSTLQYAQHILTKPLRKRKVCISNNTKRMLEFAWQEIYLAKYSATDVKYYLVRWSYPSRGTVEGLGAFILALARCPPVRADEPG